MIFEAITGGDFARVRELVDADPNVAAGRDPSGLSPVLIALYHHHWDIAEYLGDACGVRLDAFEAAALGRAAPLSRLLEQDPDLAHRRSADGFTLLHYAAYFGRAETAKLLIDHGAAVDAVATNALQVRPLHSAAAGPADHRLEVVELLLNAGADSNARHQQGYTALHAAAHVGDVGMARRLLEHGADPGLRTDGGQRAYDIAVARGHEPVAQLLTS